MGEHPEQILAATIARSIRRLRAKRIPWRDIAERHGVTVEQAREMAKEPPMPSSDARADLLERARAECVAALEDLRARVFEPPCELTLVMRHPTDPDCFLIVSRDDLGAVAGLMGSHVRDLVAAAVKAEREACAAIADEEAGRLRSGGRITGTPTRIANAIRARTTEGKP